MLGVAGANGLERVDPALTRRVIGMDINQGYLDRVQRRLAALSGFELYCRDLGANEVEFPPVDLVDAARS